jgi:hypothetical protein
MAPAETEAEGAVASELVSAAPISIVPPHFLHLAVTRLFPPSWLSSKRYRVWQFGQATRIMGFVDK